MTTPLDNIEDRFEKSKKLKVVLVGPVMYGHMFPISRIAAALVTRGHDVHVVSIGNTQGSEKLPKLYDGMGVTLHLTEGPEQDVCY